MTAPIPSSPRNKTMELKQGVNDTIREYLKVITTPNLEAATGPLFVGVDLGTAYIVTAVVNAQGVPVAGALTRSRASVRDGLVLDYVGALTILGEQIRRLRKEGLEIVQAAAAYPPGTVGRNAEVFGHVLHSVDLEVALLTDEPTAASRVLQITNGAVVDIGGGTTGISILKRGKVVYTADEATGGTHVDLVLAGHYKVSSEEAEAIKCDGQRQREVLPVIRPVFQKMASIVREHLKGQGVKKLYLVGGSSTFPGVEQVMAEECGLPVLKPEHPLLVTPLGIALCCQHHLQPAKAPAKAKRSRTKAARKPSQGA